MNELFRSFVKIAVFFIIAAIILNDVGAYFYTRYQGQDTANQVAYSFAAEYKKSQSVGAASTLAQNTASLAGARFLSYEINDTYVETSIELNIQKTVIINRVEALQNFSKVKISATAELQ